MVFIYILLALVGLFVLFGFMPKMLSYFKKGSDAPDISSKYNLGSTKQPALFYFYSDQCAACKPMTPFISKMARKNRNVIKVDVTDDMDTARKFGVMGTPSTVLVQQGKIKEFLVGPQPHDRVKQLLV